MTSNVYWIAADLGGRLAIMARPRAGDWLEDEVAGWRAAGIDIVVSLLEPSEIRELGLEDEPALCRHQGMAFRSFPVADRGLPHSRHAMAILVQELTSDIATGKSVAIHCRAGIGRSATVAAIVLLQAGINPAVIFASIALARGVAVPDTEAQRDWALSWATLQEPSSDGGMI
jgi:hypothetical protein